MHYFLLGQGVISEFSYSLDNREVHQPHTMRAMVSTDKLESSILLSVKYVILVNT